jgi:hypothetical protein
MLIQPPGKAVLPCSSVPACSWSSPVGHQRQVRAHAVTRGCREVIGDGARALLSDRVVEDRQQFGRIGADLILGQAGAAFIRQSADGDVFQAVAGRADLGIDLQPALQLELVVCAERTLVREGDILDVPAFACGHRRSGQAKGRDGGDR